jgi:hypothetical protein
MVRRASGCAGGSGLSVMASSDFGASWRRRRVLERFSHELIRATRRPADGPSRHADLRAKLSQRKLSPLPPRFASSYPPSARTVRGWRGNAALDIGHCNNDMVGDGRFPEHGLTVDR